MPTTISMKQVNKIYTTGKIPFHALKDVDFEVEQGDFVAIMGPSGSGKSTLMNIIGLLDVPSSGNYELNGIDVKDLSDDDRAYLRNQEIGFVFQSFHLLPQLTLLENVELPLVYAAMPGRERRERARIALEEVGLARWQNHRPLEVSGGQMQRTSIARALVSSPALILADEPTGNIDSQASSEIMKLISAFNERGTTVVLITHERDIAEYASRLILIRDGRLSEEQMSRHADVGVDTRFGAPAITEVNHV
ncbi:MAG TPA: ABC transporter ATP-binding protein [Clostridiaceae bacterium]|nr:ABC transporter ATP-binding protein [Clostridiaceae bacterium]